MIRLQISAQKIIIFPQARLMELSDKIHTCFHMVLAQIRDLRIEKYIPMFFGVYF